MNASKRIADLPEVVRTNTRHTMNGVLLKPARHIVLEEGPEGIYIFRYAGDWSFAGDTWHANIDDAVNQIEFEYDVKELDWKPISEEDLTALTNSI